MRVYFYPEALIGMVAVMRRFLQFTSPVLLALLLYGCADETAPGITGDTVAADVVADTSVDAVADLAVADEGPDESVELPEDVAADVQAEAEAEVAVDVDGEDSPDVSDVLADAEADTDTQTGFDVVGGDGGVLTETSDTDGGDVEAELPTDNCGELGISPYWEGSWTGGIDYDVVSSLPLNPPVGTLPVSGTLAFSISCLDSKFIVQGAMTGEAQVPGFDPVPFILNISGYYYPETGTLTTDITDGTVNIFEVVVVCFIGSFNGVYDDVEEAFSGAWTGDATGTSTPLFIGTANGTGDWSGDPTIDPPELPPETEPFVCTTPPGTGSGNP